MSGAALLVLTAHPGDFVWRAAGAIALAVSRQQRAVIGCMSFGERGESASLWRKGYCTAGLVALYREVQPTVVLTHAPADPYNFDHATAHGIALKARVLAQAPGFEGPGEVVGAPPVFCFEPQPEQCGFRPDVLLDVTPVWERKVEAMRVLGAQSHLWTYYTDLGRRRGLQATRNSGPNLGIAKEAYAEAYQRVYPQVTGALG